MLLQIWTLTKALPRPLSTSSSLRAKKSRLPTRLATEAFLTCSIQYRLSRSGSNPHSCHWLPHSRARTWNLYVIAPHELSNCDCLCAAAVDESEISSDIEIGDESDDEAVSATSKQKFRSVFFLICFCFNLAPRGVRFNCRDAR